MKSFTIDLVSNASAQFFRTIHSLNLQIFQRGNWTWKIAISEMSRSSMYQNVTQKKSCFLIKNFQIRQKTFNWNPVFTLPIQILLKLWTLSFREDTTTAEAAMQLKCLEVLNKLRFTLQKKDLVMQFLLRTWDTFLEVLLVMNLD